jgi:hypothetical protein
VNYRTLKGAASADLNTEANRLHPTPEGGDFRQPFRKRLIKNALCRTIPAKQKKNSAFPKILEGTLFRDKTFGTGNHNVFYTA